MDERHGSDLRLALVELREADREEFKGPVSPISSSGVSILVLNCGKKDVEALGEASSSSKVGGFSSSCLRPAPEAQG